MTASDKTRKSIMSAAYAQFRRKGYYRASVDEIAAAARITKRTLYYHFESKDQLLASVLQSRHEESYRQFQDFGLRPGVDAAQIVDRIFAELADWAAKPGWTGSGFSRLAMELADLSGHPARKVARFHKTGMERQLADVFAQHGVSGPQTVAREVWILLEGAMALTLIHGDRSYIEAARQAAKKLLGRKSARPAARSGKR